MREELAGIREDLVGMRGDIAKVNTNVEWLVTEWRGRDCERHLNRIEKLEVWPHLFLFSAKLLGGAGVVIGLVLGIVEIYRGNR